MANWIYLLSSWVGFLCLSHRRRETGKFSSNLRYNKGRIFCYKKEGESSDQVISSQDSPFVMVDIKGAVQKPGVYQLPKDARVKDALAQAGGATKEADLRQLNLASKLQDEMAVYIPAAGEEIPLHLQFLQSLPQELQMISPLLISIQRTLMNCKR